MVTESGGWLSTQSYTLLQVSIKPSFYYHVRESLAFPSLHSFSQREIWKREIPSISFFPTLYRIKKLGSLGSTWIIYYDYTSLLLLCNIIIVLGKTKHQDGQRKRYHSTCSNANSCLTPMLQELPDTHFVIIGLSTH
jgi:hypothetical protein